MTVFAASSLTNVFDRLWAAFKAQAGNEGIAITANYGGSTQLRTQLQEGAAADIFAPADLAQMEQNIALVAYPIPADFWQELKREGLLRQDAPVPAT